MKLRTIILSMLAIALLTNCSNDDDGRGGPPVSDTDVAYVSIKIETQRTTRSSGENPGKNESDLLSIYLVTFNDDGEIIGVPGTGNYYTKLPSAATAPNAIKVGAIATKLLVLANPGDKLETAILNLGVTSTFSSFNAAIEKAVLSEVTGDIKDAPKGFAMINSGDESKFSAGQKMSDLLIGISGKIQKVTEDLDEEAAKKKAEEEENRIDIKIERLSSKLELKTADDITVPEGASFVFGKWTLDAVNTAFFPCAEKTFLSVPHSADEPFYAKNFYTHDPNFAGAIGAGLDFTKINPDTYEPELVAPYEWKDASVTATPAILYCVENTMDAAEQKFGNATRVVIKGTYYPPKHPSKTGDWFNFAGKNFMNLTELQTEYSNAEDDSNLKKVCDKMFGKIKDFVGESVLGPGTDFMDLTTDILEDVPNGGEMIKEGKADVIRWYQNGLSYYYYEIRHDNETVKEMNFGKYGVVRNNWYSLTLGSVSGAGTPWYPDPNNPGPGDPDPTDPIDGSTGFLGITVKTAPWIIWENIIGV